MRAHEIVVCGGQALCMMKRMSGDHEVGDHSSANSAPFAIAGKELTCREADCFIQSGEVHSNLSHVCPKRLKGFE